MDFSNLKKLDVDAKKTVRHTLYDLEEDPVLILSQANEANKPYFNAMLKRTRRNQQRYASGKWTVDLVKENRDNDRKLYSQFVVRGWEGVVNSEGQEVEATPENVLAFLTALPDWIFDGVRGVAADNQSFIDLDVDIEDTAGNLQEG